MADLSGFTAMAETMDAEEVARVMNDLWVMLDSAIVNHGGGVGKTTGGPLKAPWGGRTGRGGEPEAAGRAGGGVGAAPGGVEGAGPPGPTGGAPGRAGQTPTRTRRAGVGPLSRWGQGTPADGVRSVASTPHRAACTTPPA